MFYPKRQPLDIYKDVSKDAANCAAKFWKDKAEAMEVIRPIFPTCEYYEAIREYYYLANKIMEIAGIEDN